MILILIWHPCLTPRPRGKEGSHLRMGCSQEVSVSEDRNCSRTEAETELAWSLALVGRRPFQVMEKILESSWHKVDAQDYYLSKE